MSKLNNKVQKIISSGRFSHFIHFFLVFTGIFVIMTTIILQIMRNGLYSNVDSSLSRISSKTDDYVEMIMGRSSLVNQDSEVSKSNNSNPKLSEQIVANTDIILFSDDRKILNADNIFFASWESLKLNKKYLSKIYEISLTNIFGHEEKYHIVTVKVKNSSYPDVKYMSVIINVDQLATANERYERIIIVVMATFWLISIGASVYLANWTRKPIIESYEKQKAFVENASHELRTPLAVMQLQIDLYNSSKHPDNDTSAQQTISMITEQTERLGKMVRTLLDMSELQTIARDEEIAISALVEEVLADLEPLAQEKGINLIEKCDNVLLMGSDILIYRLVYNLVENAIKYNFSDGTVTVTATQQNSQLHLTVEDTGNGIPEELKERIFEPFFRLDKSRSRELGGVGLGLALVREIVRVHNGSILVKNNANSGTTFEVIFP